MNSYLCKGVISIVGCNKDTLHGGLVLVGVAVNTPIAYNYENGHIECVEEDLSNNGPHLNLLQPLSPHSCKHLGIGWLGSLEDRFYWCNKPVI